MKAPVWFGKIPLQKLTLFMLAMVGLILTGQGGIMFFQETIIPQKYLQRMPKGLSSFEASREFFNPDFNFLYIDKQVRHHSLPKQEERGSSDPDEKIKVAIGLAFTSKGVNDTGLDNIVEKFVFFNTLLPSFCLTRSKDDIYLYTFYLAYDKPDKLFSTNTKRLAFISAFNNVTSRHCGPTSNVALKLVRCAYSKSPAWSQNDAMMEAYLDNHDYYYRINDDIIMTSPDWTSQMISILRRFVPSNVGVVVPTHNGMHTNHTEFDFVHRTHVDIFGWYYPRVFKDLYGDIWMGEVYRQSGRLIWARDVTLDHTQAVGKRYDEIKSLGSMRRFYLKPELERSTAILNSYLADLSSSGESKFPDEKRVIVMSLYGPNYSSGLGAIRNARLIKRHFPGWTLRIYMAMGNNSPSIEVHKRFVRILVSLGVEIVVIDDEDLLSGVHPDLWKFLVLDDDSVDVAIARNPADRITARQAALVDEWLQHSDDENEFSCIRDGFKPAKQPIMDDTWGAKVKLLKQKLGYENVASILISLVSELAHSNLKEYDSANDVEQALETVIWPLVEGQTLVLDSWAHVGPPYKARAIPADLEINPFKKRFEYVGHKYDSYETLSVFREEWTKIESDDFPFTKKGR